jgi:CBS domain-containing protein
MFIRSSWRNPVSVTENAGMFETIEYMRAQGVRREPVVDKGARLVRHEQQNETISRH